MGSQTLHVSAELLRENKRMLDKAIRDLDRERMGLQNQEKKLVVEIKKAAKQGQMVRAHLLRCVAPAAQTSHALALAASYILVEERAGTLLCMLRRMR